MDATDYDQLEADFTKKMADTPGARIGIVGHTPLALHVVALLGKYAVHQQLVAIYADLSAHQPSGVTVRPLESLATDKLDIVIIAADEEKEDLLNAALPYLAPSTGVLLAGHGHFQFRDELFTRVKSEVLVPSLANGYPHSQIHLYQCLQNAARLALQGVVVEFGMFRGGTTMLLSRFIEALGADWEVIGFDSFDGFPPPRSVLDMYKHPDCVFRDQGAVRQYLAGRRVQIIPGDIVNTARQVKGKPIVLAFIDTDNFTSANAALDAVQDGVVVGGALVFDHFTGRNRHKYTLGERLAAKRLLSDSRYFNLHDTGVFIRQR